MVYLDLVIPFYETEITFLLMDKIALFNFLLPLTTRISNNYSNLSSS